MPLEKIVLDHHRAWALWQINEDEQELAAQISQESIPPAITNPQKRREWLTARILVKEVMNAMGASFQGITKDEFGKPFLNGYPYQLSLSHSFPYVAALIDQDESVGIDLEQPKEKLLKIAPRVLHAEELRDAGTDLLKHCIYWCAKESLIKVHGKKDLTFAENLIIGPFSRKNEGDIVGRIIVNNQVTIVPLYYSIYPNFILVFTKRSPS
jgi:4'-phosphopantetheinyl transferase